MIQYNIKKGDIIKTTEGYFKVKVIRSDEILAVPSGKTKAVFIPHSAILCVKNDTEFEVVK